jgi:hypothetical protein
MKYKTIGTLIFCVFLAAAAAQTSSQEEITGAGTPGYIPQFTGKHKVGNSNIYLICSPQGKGANIFTTD